MHALRCTCELVGTRTRPAVKSCRELLRVLKKGSNPQEEKKNPQEEKKNPQEEKTNLQEEKSY